MLSGVVGFCAALALLALQPQAAAADASADYLHAVQRAYDLIRDASPQDSRPAASALQALKAGTGNSQPEIIDDLNLRPPDYEDAKARLAALLDRLGHSAATSDPVLAKQRLHDVMSMSRYDALHRPPSPFERFLQWVNDRINDFFSLILGKPGGARAPDWVFYVSGIAALVAIAVVVFRTARGRLSEGTAALPPGPRPPADYFADADRLAAQGDRLRAIRALCAGVAATLAGEKTWEGSPLTVREIFRRAPNAAGLQPLLQPFEAAVYGGRDVDEVTYEKAAAAAAPYRVPEEKAA